MKAGSRRVIICALLANMGIAAAKFIGFLVTGSASMLAEAVHSVADSGNQALLVVGGILAARKPSAEHPFGYGRERYFWAFVVSVVLFVLGSLFSLYEGVTKMHGAHPIESSQWAIGILLLALVLEATALRAAVHEGNRLRRGESWWGFIRQARSPEVPVVLLEDSGAVIGLVLALLGVGIGTISGDSRFDALGSVGIGILLAVIATVLAIEMKSLLIGEAARPDQLRQIREIIEAAPGVCRILDLRTLHLGPDQLLVAGKLELEAGFDFGRITALLNGIEARARAAVPAVRMMYLEPDVPGSVEPAAIGSGRSP